MILYHQMSPDHPGEHEVMVIDHDHDNIVWHGRVTEFHEHWPHRD